VCAGLIAKMRARHPHLYGDGVKRSWEAMKAKRRLTLEEGLPPGLPSLHRAHRLQDRAAGVGFDWPDAEGPAEKVAEELAEVRVELARAGSGAPTSPPDPALEAELGDLLFAVVNLCRKTGVHASLALDRANAKFAGRFAAVEQLAAARGIDVREVGLETLDALWDEVKATEPSEPGAP
jgi:MazG family protein